VGKVQPDIIINSAGYTSVDKAESEPALCYQINTIAPEVLTDKAIELNIPLIHFSTDYVFDGLKKEAYIETDPTNPLSVYAKTACEGEVRVRKHLKHIILRTGWVFGDHGNNFLKTILKLIQEKKTLNIVSDQEGTPTSSNFLAEVTYRIVKSMVDTKNFNAFGTYHAAMEGYTDWYRYACFIMNEAIQLGLETSMTSLDIKPILSCNYPTPAKRSSNSKLCADKIQKAFMLELPHWEDEVKRVMRGIIH
jgi:dTDP-4-dehydrorhamnose reductase